VLLPAVAMPAMAIAAPAAINVPMSFFILALW
jgi:hypothetical protein